MPETAELLDLLTKIIGPIIEPLRGIPQALGEIKGELVGVRTTTDATRAEMAKLNHDQNNMRTILAAQRVDIDGLKGDVADLQKQAQESATARTTWQSERRVMARFEKWWLVVAGAVSASVLSLGSTAITHRLGWGG